MKTLERSLALLLGCAGLLSCQFGSDDGTAPSAEPTATAVVVDPCAPIGLLSSTGDGHTLTTLQYDLAGHLIGATYRQDSRPAMVFTTTYGYARRAATSGELGAMVRSQIYPDGEEVSYT